MNYYENNFVPVLLGDDRALFLALMAKYGTTVHIFSEKCPFAIKFSSFSRFHRIKSVPPEILLMYLSYFAQKCSDGKIPVIVSDRAHERAFEKIKNRLETDYLILSREEIL